MTAPITHLIISSDTDCCAAPRPVLSFPPLENRIETLRRAMFPLTGRHKDHMGEEIQIWSIPDSKVIGVKTHATGEMTLFTNVINGLSPSDNLITIHNKLLLASKDCKWQFISKKDGTLTIFPFLSAAGWRDVLPRSQTDLSGLTRLSRMKTQEQMCTWFYTNGYQVINKPNATIEIYLQGQSAGQYKPSEQGTIRNLLRQGGTIQTVKYEPPTASEAQDKFAGRGMVFQHPNDKNQTTFNMDFSQALRPDGKWDREREGGYHIDVKSPKFEAKVKVSTRETYEANSNSRKQGNDASYEIHEHFVPFRETLQKTGLTKSYNSCHPDNPVSKGAGGGEIGGVGCTVELIEGLFDSPESLFETSHSFFIPEFEDGKVPFTSQEMRQIVHELARGIFIHNTVPFFSLHFNQEANLYPVIHPAYENTLVGQVFSMLDYFMKGYLNGGVFMEKFLQQWHKNPHENKVTETLLRHMINFKSYAETHLEGSDKNYISVRELIKRAELSALEKAAAVVGEKLAKMADKDFVPENPIFKDYTKFTNSFRIIAKQRGIHKAESLFFIDADFDVEYTIEPNPDYQKALDEHYKLHGSYPEAYSCLIEAYEAMKQQIHDHMVKMPFCRKYFAMLGVINFFSYYFRTMQKHQKIPILPAVELQPAQCPSLFPPLPILGTRQEDLLANIYTIVVRLIARQTPFLKKYLKKEASVQEIAQVKQELETYFYEEVCSHASAPMRRQLTEKAQSFRPKIGTIAESVDVLSIFKTNFDALELQTRNMENRKPITEIIEIFITKFPEMTAKLNKTEKICTLQLDLFLLPSEQTQEEKELGKRIVGGCGMVLHPQKVQPSTEGRGIVERAWPELHKASFGEYTRVEASDATDPRGVIFTLPFADMPLGLSDDLVYVETLLATPGKLKTSSSLRIRALLQAISQNNETKFSKLMKNVDVKKLEQAEKLALLHQSVAQQNSFFTSECLKLGFTSTLPDENGYLPIHYAAMSGNVAQLKELVHADQTNLKAKSPQGATPLITAIQHGRTDAAKYLLTLGADGDERLHDGYTPLHCAAHRGDEEMVKMLLGWAKVKNTVNTPTNEGITPFLVAVRLGSLGLTTLFIDNGALVTQAASNGRTALEMAVRKDRLNLCRLLAPRSKLAPTTIEEGIKNGSLEINQLLSGMPGYLTHVNALNENPLMISIRYANIPVAMLVLGFNDPNILNASNRLGQTAIKLAVQGRFYPLLEELLKRGAHHSLFDLFSLLLQNGYQGQNDDINRRLEHNWTKEELQKLALASAQAGNHVGLTKLLVTKNVDLSKIVSDTSWKIEHYLARSDGIYLFRRRMEESQDLLMPLASENGKTLPYIAAQNGSWRVLEFLLGKMNTTKTSLKKHHGKKHLFYGIVKRGDPEGIRLFMENMDDKQIVNEPVDTNGTLPVHLAAQFCSEEALQLLYQYGANLNVKDQKGHYPLFYAVERKDLPAIQFFLQAGHFNPVTADVLCLAAGFKSEEIFNLLLSSCGDCEECENDEKDTALLLAIKSHNRRAAMRLIQSGALVDHTNRDGWTPFLLASKEGLENVLDLILDINPKVLSSTFKGNNALHIACVAGNDHCVRLLCKRGAVVNSKNTNGETAAVLANKNMAVLTSLNPTQKKSQFQELSEKLHQAVVTQDLSDISKNLSSWPMDLYFTLHIRGITIRGTLLHLVLMLFHDHDEQRKITNAVFGHLSINTNLRDSEGNTYAHLLIKNKIDPVTYELSLEEKNNKGETPLHWAARGENITILPNLVKTLGRSKLDPTDRKGCTPLFYAVYADRLANIECLVRAGVDLEHRSLQGATPLIIACVRGNYRAARCLVEQGADVNRCGSRKELTPLSVSLRSKHEDIPLFLLFHGANINSLHLSGHSLGHVAAAEGKIYILRFLAEQGLSLSAVSPNGLQPIHEAASRGKKKSLEFLNNAGLSIETPVVSTGNEKPEVKILTDATPLLLASMTGTVEAIKWLVDHGAKPDTVTSYGLNILQGALRNSAINSQEIIRLFKDYLLLQDLRQILPAVRLAIAKDHVEPLKLLCEMGVPVHTKLDHGNTSLHLACACGSPRVTGYLLVQGVDTTAKNDNGELPIELAAANDSPEQFRLMLNNTTYAIDGQNMRGETLMHIAVRADNLIHLLQLIDLGADYDVRDAQGLTPLHAASQNDFIDCAKVLLIVGADTQIKTTFNSHTAADLGNQRMKDLFDSMRMLKDNAPKGSTSLHIAVRADHALSVRLCARHIDVNAKNELGRTPLHDAVTIGSLVNVRELLEQGANPLEKDLKEITPLMLATTEAPHPSIANCLKAI